MILRKTRSLDILRDFLRITVIDGTGLDSQGSLPNEFQWNVFWYCVMNDDDRGGARLYVEVSFIRGGIRVRDARTGEDLWDFPFGTDSSEINDRLKSICPDGLYTPVLLKQ